MATLDDLRKGIYGTVHIDHPTGERSFEHAILRFNHDNGGVLEVPLDAIYSDGLQNVRFTNLSNHIFLPLLFYRSAENRTSLTRNEFVFNELLLSHGPWLPQNISFSRVEFEVDHMRHYFGMQPIEQLANTGEPLQIRALTEMLVTEAVDQWNAKMFVKAQGKVVSQPDASILVRPTFNVGLAFKDTCTFAAASNALFQLTTFWEFMTQRPVSPTRVVYHGDPMLSPALYLSKSSPAASFDIHWFSGQGQMHWGLCSQWVGDLARKWASLDMRSPWMDNFVRLINHSNLPSDVRFIMAYTALQGFGEELGLARPLKKRGLEEDRMWSDFERFWLVGLGLDKMAAQRYTEKLVRTRHHFAHLSKRDEDILKTTNEYAIAYLNLMNTIKAMFLVAVRVPAKEWQSILTQWGNNVQSLSGSMRS